MDASVQPFDDSAFAQFAPACEIDQRITSTARRRRKAVPRHSFIPASTLSDPSIYPEPCIVGVRPMCGCCVLRWFLARIATAGTASARVNQAVTDLLRAPSPARAPASRLSRSSLPVLLLSELVSRGSGTGCNGKPDSVPVIVTRFGFASESVQSGSSGGGGSDSEVAAERALDSFNDLLLSLTQPAPTPLATHTAVPAASTIALMPASGETTSVSPPVEAATDWSNLQFLVGCSADVRLLYVGPPRYCTRTQFVLSEPPAAVNANGIWSFHNPVQQRVIPAIKLRSALRFCSDESNRVLAADDGDDAAGATPELKLAHSERCRYDVFVMYDESLRQTLYGRTDRAAAARFNRLGVLGAFAAAWNNLTPVTHWTQPHIEIAPAYEYRCTDNVLWATPSVRWPLEKAKAISAEQIPSVWHAFAHFVYETARGRFALSVVQTQTSAPAADSTQLWASADGKSFLVSDCALHSASSADSNTLDLRPFNAGLTGCAQFSASHVCNSFCAEVGLSAPLSPPAKLFSSATSALSAWNLEPNPNHTTSQSKSTG